ncbi:MAG: hypothetical protein ACTHM9_10205 [Gemmatimonadales bacterium]|jgi:hypothetical protein
MIVVRNIFQVKFGQAREAIAAWKQGMSIAQRTGATVSSQRLLTDVAGPDFYTLVLEGTYPSLAEFERSAQAFMASAEFRAWYPAFAALCVGGRREILTVVE